jgi:hypothetical protein
MLRHRARRQCLTVKQTQGERQHVVAVAVHVVATEPSTMLDALVHLPLIMPPVVTGYVLLLLLGLFDYGIGGLLDCLHAPRVLQCVA